MATANHTSVTPVGQPEYQIRDVPGLTGYRVDTIGQVWTNRYNCRLKKPYNPATPYRLLSSRLSSYGYPQVRIHIDGYVRFCRVHRLVLETFVGPSPNGMVCRHLDGTRTNNRLENLVWGTSQENARDRKRHGTELHGDRRPGAKLTNDQAREIRQRYAVGDIKRRTLEAEYGVTRTVIADILTGKTYVEAGGPIGLTPMLDGVLRRNTKLTEDQVREIRRRLCQPGVKGKDLAAEYGVSQSNISSIRRGNSRQRIL